MSLSKLVSATLLVPLAFVPACTDGGPVALDTDSPAVLARDEGSVALRPQPEPPGHFRFVFLMEQDGDEWFGTFGDGERSCGVVELTDPTTTESGQVTHVSFDLRMVTHDASWQVEAHLAGILNGANGLTVLNGATTGGSLFGARVHQLGHVVQSDGDDPMSFLGELMLRPQPEPPGRSGTPQFPPSPC